MSATPFLFPGSGLKWLVARNALVQLLAQAVFVLVGLAMTVVLSRHLGVEGFGYFSYVFAFLYFFQVLNDLAVTTIVVREVARVPARAEEIVGGMLTFKLLLAAGSVLAAWATAWALALPPPLLAAVAVFALCLPLWALQLPMVLFQVTLRAVEPAAIGIGARLVGLGLVLGMVRWGRGLTAVCVALLLAEAVSTLLILTATRRLVRLQWRLDPALWVAVLRSSLPLAGAALFGAFVARVDFLLLERLADPRALGLYAAAYKVTNLLEAVPHAVMGTVYPVMAHYSAADMARAARLYRRVTIHLGLLAVAVGGVTTLAAPLLVRALFGPAFAGADEGLRVLVWATACLYAALPGGHLLVSLGRERTSLWLNGTAALLNIALNVVLIPRWSFVGAALATTVAWVWLFAGTTVSARRALLEPSGAAGQPPGPPPDSRHEARGELAGTAVPFLGARR